MRKFDEKNQKTLTNKGFSLVELIIVIAIMAVLIGVLAPQYLRYVEKSRLQKDNTSISEVANVLKMSSADETVINALSSSGATYKFTSNVLTASGVTDLDKEVEMTIKLADVKLTSTTYTTAAATPELVVSIDSNKIIKVVANNWIEKPGATPTTKTF
ncbi:MAG: prepilin-type N-terminal cleavage/methylation domain-containing protein [Lachnospiraceae bacterium]|nr:prepilin-type N-terminal cleavage/methylation domain-containing protein [Lachnospiraceae bacterium]